MCRFIRQLKYAHICELHPILGEHIKVNDFCRIFYRKNILEIQNIEKYENLVTFKPKI